MISEAELFVMGFLSLGGVVALIPAVLLGKITITGLLKVIGSFLAIIVASSLFYLAVTDANLLEILTLKANTTLLPKRIFSVSYTMLIIFIVVLPVALLRAKFSDNDENA